VKNTENTIKQQ